MANPFVTSARVEDEVKKALARALRKEPSAIPLDASIVRDLGGSSLDFLDVTFRLEQAFGVQDIPPHVEDRSEDLHAGPLANKGSFSYQWHGNRAHCGVLAFAFAMMPMRPGDGGLVLVPGSHKQNLPIEGLHVWNGVLERRFDAWWLHEPTLDPGDLLVFTEAVVHGTRAWRPRDRGRRRVSRRGRRCS